MSKAIITVPAIFHGSNASKIRLISEKRIILTQSIARAMLSIPRIDDDRTLSIGHVNLLKTLMIEGRFPWDLARIITCRVGDDRRRLDANHTLEAYSSIGRDMSDALPMLLEYEAVTWEDMVSLYCKIDRNMRRRTPRDATRIRFRDHRDYRFVDVMRTGLTLWRSIETGQSIDTEQSLDMLEGEYRNATKIIDSEFELFGPTATKHVRRAPTVAAMFAMLASRHNRLFCEFWRGVILGEGLLNGDVRKRLRDTLLASGIRGDTKIIGSRNSMGRRQAYGVCTNAIQAFAAGKSPTRLKTDPIKSVDL